ncbi:recombinase family protein [Streptomyces sp. BRA346]|uniref:recombinase family protein n=1 Tax=Streptomyces sp. BRA346 TaxID=2878199 RepID=UPI004064848E
MSAAPLRDDFEIPPQARRGRATLNPYDQLTAYIPKRPGAYLRISSGRFDLEAGVDRQHEDAEDTRSRLQWGPCAKIYKENDTSAFKKRTVVRDDGSIDWVVIRPKFRELLADLASGVIDGVIFYDLDRLVRQPRDLQDLIDIVEYVQRPAVGATGGRMNLINDSDRGRVQGRIAYGWVRKGPDKGTLIPEESGVVVRHLRRLPGAVRRGRPPVARHLGTHRRTKPVVPDQVRTPTAAAEQWHLEGHQLSACHGPIPPLRHPQVREVVRKPRTRISS